MATFQLDHNLAHEVGALLQAGGHAAATAQSLGLAKGEDAEQLFAAILSNAILVTYDRNDFRLLHYAWRRWPSLWGVGPVHPGIIVCPQWSAMRIARVLVGGYRLPNELYFWRQPGGWVRYADPHWDASSLSSR